MANVYEVTVAWGDCDPAGIVFYPNYIRWFDEASRRLFAAAGLPWDTLFRQYDIIGLPLVSATADFRGPSRHGDTLVIHSEVKEWRRATWRPPTTGGFDEDFGVLSDFR